MSTGTPSAALPLNRAVALIRQHLELRPVPGLDGVQLYAPHRASGLGRLVDVVHGDDAQSPYWAYVWAGGLALARHVQQHQELVRGRHVLDYGTGSGLVAITAALAGASDVVATDSDLLALAATRLNAEANGVAVTPLRCSQAPATPDLVLAGDVFYDAAVAQTSIDAFDRWQAAGVPILVGDPGRRDLPLGRLQRLADYLVPDMGDSGTPTAQSSVYSWR